MNCSCTDFSSMSWNKSSSFLLDWLHALHIINSKSAYLRGSLALWQVCIYVHLWSCIGRTLLLDELVGSMNPWLGRVKLAITGSLNTTAFQLSRKQGYVQRAHMCPYMTLSLTVWNRCVVQIKMVVVWTRQSAPSLHLWPRFEYSLTSLFARFYHVQ